MLNGDNMEQESMMEEAQLLKARESERTKCEVYSRIVGYLRPVAQWNTGKQAEFRDRKTYDKTEGV